MANVLTPVDVYQIMNSIADATIGKQAQLTAVDTSSFVTVAEAVLKTGYENTLNALTTQLTNTIFAIRPYQGDFHSIETVSQPYGLISRKISYFYQGFQQETAWNTQLEDENLKDGNSIDHYKITKRYPLEMHFGGLKVLKKRYTRFLDQLQIAFRGPGEFDAFYRGLGVEIANEIAMKKSLENRLVALNEIGQIYNTGMPKSRVNLTLEFNQARGTNYTSAQLRNEHLKEFLEFLVVKLRTDIRLMEENNTLFHLTPAKTDDAGNPLTLLRHTPRSEQRLLLYEPLLYDAEARVMPTIFNPQYLRIENYEGVLYWQNVNSGAAVNVTPNQLNTSTWVSSTGANVQIPYVVGLLYDRPAMVTCYKTDRVLTTPVNADGVYYNTVHHWSMDYQCDPTENAILYYMEDPAPNPSEAANYPEAVTFEAGQNNIPEEKAAEIATLKRAQKGLK